MPKLIMTSAGETRQVDLQPYENTLGRGSHNRIVLNSTFASRRHAVIVVEPAFTTIRDLGSLNGTFVNGVRIETQPLADGDIVRLGGCEMRFVAADQDFSEIEARGVSSVPGWVLGNDAAPTAPDQPKDFSKKQ